MFQFSSSLLCRITSKLVDLFGLRKDESNEDFSQTIIAGLLRNASEDILFEILTRVSLDTLQQCRSVNPRIDQMADTWHFMQRLCQRTEVFSGYIVPYYAVHAKFHKFVSVGGGEENAAPKISDSVSLDFLPLKNDVRIEAVSSSGGLVYCHGMSTYGKYARRRYNHYVCKPTTKEWVQIWTPKTRFESQANAIVVQDTRPMRYKIVRFSKSFLLGPYDYKHFCEIYDSRTRRWRRSKDVVFKNYTALTQEPTVYVNEALHWITNYEEIFAFDLKTETWEMKQLPKQVVTGRSYNSALKLVEYRGKIALFNSSGCGNVEHWVMTDYAKETWTKVGDIVDQGLGTPVDFYTSDAVLSCKNSTDQELIVKNPATKNAMGLTIRQWVKYRNIFPFKSDFVHCF